MMSDDQTVDVGKNAETPVHRSGWRRWLLIAAGLGLLLAIVGGGTFSVLEENDRFCASCHMVPERTYYNRAQFALAGVDPIEDLASAHYLADAVELPSGEAFRCIDCHRGDEGILHRATALTLGARDSVIYLVGNPDQTIEKTDIEVPVLLTDSCLKCHTEILLVVGFPNHFHNRLPAAYDAWQGGGTLTLPELDPEIFEPDLEEGLEQINSDLLCVDCHLAHIHTPGSELQSFLDLDNIVYESCEDCHISELGNPLGLTNLQDQ